MGTITMTCFTDKGSTIGLQMSIFWAYSRRAARRKVPGMEKTSTRERSKITCGMESALTFTPMAKFMKESGLWARDMAVASSLSLQARSSSVLSKRAINGGRVLTCSKDVELWVFGMVKTQ